MRPPRSRRRLAAPAAALALALGSCGETAPVGQAEPFVGSAAVGPPRGPGRPPAPGAATAVGAGDGWAFSYPDRPGVAPALDLRGLNEATAGQAGFVRLSADGDGFVLGSGAPARFWAINSEVFRQTPEAIDRNVRFLARAGVNLVRLHAQVSPKGAARATDVDEKELDGIWRYVAAAKAQGIYTAISPFWTHWVDATNWGIEGYGVGGVEGLLFFDETLQAAYKGWTRALLTRPNPYTGVRLADEPAVALLQVQNEDSLLWWSSDAIKPPARAKLAGKFTAWAVARYGSVDRALRAWDGFAAPHDAPAAGRLGLIDLWHLTQRQPGGNGRRVGDQLTFYAELQRQFYAGMAAYFRDDLGCRQLVNASNWRTADDVTLDDVERWSYAGVDVIAANKYYNGGVHLGPNAGWRIDPGDRFSQRSALVDPRGMPFNLKQVAGHPMIVTESSWVAPLGFAAEGPFLAAVYPSLTGVDAFCWFSDIQPEYDLNPFFPFGKVDGQDPFLKWTATTPMIVGGFPAAAVLFRGGYVRQGAPVVHEERPLASLWNREDPLIAEGPAFDPGRDPGVSRNSGASAGSSRLAGSRGADPLAFLAGPVEVRYGGAAAQTRVAPELARLIDPARKVVRSITGEITLDHGRGLCTVDAPRAQGACGFLDRAGPIRLGDATLSSANPFAAVLVVPLDGRPLATSRRTLVQVTAPARPTGWAAAEVDFAEGPGKPPLHGYRVTRTGQAPWRVASTRVTLTLRNPALTRATRIDPAGYPAGAVAVRKDPAGLTLTLPPDAMYTILE